MKAKTKLSVWARSAFALLLSTLCIKPATAYANIFVTSLNGTIGEYTNSGAVVNASLITGLNTPVGIQLFFTENGFTGRVGEATTSGMNVNEYLIGNLSSPDAITAAGSHLFVTGQFPGLVNEFNLDGSVVHSPLITGLNTPYGIAV